jgi:TRAP-type C4-dicarboxylate transport system permease small subunit
LPLSNGDARALGTTEAIDGEANLFTIALDLRRWWTIIPELVVTLCAAAIPVVVSISVLSRYTDWYHAFWTDDVVKVLFLWVVFLGGAVAVKYDAHVRMGLFSDRLVRAGRPWAWWSEVIACSPILAGIMLIVLGWQLVTISMRRELPSLEISAGYFMIIVPLSGALITYYVVRKMVGGYRSSRLG